ncbi:MAG: hypothetical protein K8R54_07155 [Bacteroidales bacterium]|nr:hypothetical protein [Bacteroidales bacterium]
MKTKLLLLLCAVLLITNEGFGQFAFGVSPGIGLNSAYFGYKINSKIVPYVSLQYLNANYKYDHSGERYSYDLNRVVSYTDEYEFKGNLFIPNIGVKYFFMQQNKLQAYLSLNFSKPIFSGKIDVDDNDFEDDFEEAIKNISMWGGEFGFGIEYFFDENFSLGGEFGIRHLHFKYNNTYDSYFWNPDTGDDQRTEITDDMKLNMNPTFSKISVNYYF